MLINKILSSFCHVAVRDSYLAGLDHWVYPTLWTPRLFTPAARSQNKAGTYGGNRVRVLLSSCRGGVSMSQCELFPVR